MMSMWTEHYGRRNIHVWKMAPSVQGSIIIKNIPNNGLITFENLVDKILKDKDNDVVHSASQIKMYLQDLINQKCVFEVHGERLFKFTKEFSK